MQITLNSNEVSEVVREHIQSRLGLDDASNYSVEVNEDGSITVYVDEDSNYNSGSAPTGEKPARKTRRTKAQIEADNKAEADRLLQAQADAATNTGSGEAGTAVKTEGGTQVASEAGTNETKAIPEPTVETGTESAEDLPLDQTGEAGLVEGGTEVVGETGEAPANTATGTVVEQVGQADAGTNTNLAENAQEEAAPTSPARSLFKGLRTPRNQ